MMDICLKRFQYRTRILLICALLALVNVGLTAIQARPGFDPTADYLGPAGHLGGAATAVRLLPDAYACLALGNDLLIFDVLDPFHPAQVGKLSFPNVINDLHLLGNTAYVLVEERVHIVDLSVPSHPAKGTILPVEHVRDIDGDLDYLYVAALDTHIYSLANPASPALIGTYVTYQDGYDENTQNYVRSASLGVVAAYPYLYLREENLYCELLCWPAFEYHKIIDISDPTSPIQIRTTGDYSRTKVYDVAEYQDVSFVSVNSIQDSQPDGVVLVVSPANMASLTPEAIIPVGGESLAVQGNRLYVAGSAAGLHIFDISNPLAAVELGGDPSISDARDVAATDQLAFVAGGSQGLVVYNVRDPGDPQRSGGFRTAGTADRVTLAGNYVYASSDRLDIVDISNPSAPEVVANYDQRGAPVVSGEVLYLAAGEDGLAAVDISDPTAPVELGVLPLPGEARAVTVAGEYAYVASSSGLQVVDISNLQAMSLIGTADDFQATDVAVSEGTSVLIDNHSAIFFDVSVPEAPQRIFEYSMPNEDESGYTCGYEPGIPRGVAVAGGRVYVIWDILAVEAKICWLETGGMLVFEQDSQSEWQLISKTGLGRSLDIEISNGIGYVLTGDRADEFRLYDQLRWTRLWVFDATNPPYTNSLTTYTFKTWVSPNTDWQIDLAVEDGQVVMGKHEAGISVLQWWPERIFLPAIHTP